MEDPLYEATITVGGKSSTYSFDAFPKKLHSNQSFILTHTYVKPDNTPYDISGSVATLYVSAYNNQSYETVPLASGVLSGSDSVTFTVAKDLIPVDLGSFPLGKPGNSVFYVILEDTDSILEFSEILNVIDPSYGLQGNTDPSSSAIVTQRNDLGTVESVTETTPPAPTLSLSYIVGIGATGEWAGQDNNLAVGNGSAWIFTLSEEGNFVFAKDVDEQRIYDGASWNANVASGLPVADTTNIVQGNVDATKQMRIDVETNVSTGTTRVLTMPDNDVTAGLDADAVHVDVAGEIDALTEKASPVSADLLIIEDSEDSNNKKKVEIGSLPSSGGTSLPVDDTTAIVQDPADNTRTMRIDVGAVTTATERTLFMPDSNVDLTPNSGTFLGDISGDSTPQLGGELDTDSNDINFNNDSNIIDLLNLGLSDFLELTISSNSITASRNLHSIDTQAEAATDDLDTIVVGDSNIIYITQNNASRVVTLKDGTGNLDIGADIEMSFGVIYQLINNGVDWQLVGSAGGSSSSAGGILPESESSKTADYTILVGDVGTRVELGAGNAANRTFTLDVSLLADSTEQISFINKSDYRLEIEVSNTGTMTFNDIKTNIYLWKGDGIITVNGDTSTNANIVAGG